MDYSDSNFDEIHNLEFKFLKKDLMLIQIKEKTTMKGLRKQFADAFNCLSLEFSGDQFIPFDFDSLGYDRPVFDLMRVKCNLEFELNGNTKACELEGLLDSLLKVHCEIYRKTEKLWARIAKSDDRSLSIQQQIGEKALLHGLVEQGIHAVQ
jgi:hypothetical protein